MIEQAVRFGGMGTQQSRTGLAECAESGAAVLPPLLAVRDLTVRFSDVAGRVTRPLTEVSFQIRANQTLGVLGESGAGKTTLALALMRLLPPGAHVVGGEIEFQGRQLLSLGNEDLRKLRGSRISLIYQDSSVLNPVLTVGNQVVEVLRAHFRWPKARYRERAMALLEEVEFRDVERIYAAYPHQLSGGQRQRIIIAQALACEPALIVADEPTSALDPRTAAEIIGLLFRLKQRSQASLLLISHDLDPLAQLSDRVMVMYAGRLVEQGPCNDVLEHPLHPYTRSLLACSPGAWGAGASRRQKQLLPVIPGSPPDSAEVPRGCDFESRCSERMSLCRARVPEEIAVLSAHSVRCFKLGG